MCCLICWNPKISLLVPVPMLCAFLVPSLDYLLFLCVMNVRFFQDLMLRIDQLEEDITELEREKSSGEAAEGIMAASEAENPEEDIITGETTSVASHSFSLDRILKGTAGFFFFFFFSKGNGKHQSGAFPSKLT